MNTMGATFRLIFFCVSLISFTVTAQDSTYYIRGRLFYGKSIRKNEPVSLIREGREMKQTLSDSLGHFKFFNLRNGDYLIRVNQFSIDTSFVLLDKDLDPVWIFLPATCEVDKEIALSDIANGKPRLLLVGGIAPVIYEGQEKFEKRFKVSYYDFGCTPPDYACIKEYNTTIFNFLDQQYGRRWRKYVRRDVEFLK